MDVFPWTTGNWMGLLNAVGVVVGRFVTAFALRSETKTRRIANLLAITQSHRELWKEFLGRPELARVLVASVDLAKQPITREEEIFVNLVILHISSVYYATKNGLVIKLD